MRVQAPGIPACIAEVEFSSMEPLTTIAGRFLQLHDGSAPVPLLDPWMPLPRLVAFLINDLKLDRGVLAVRESSRERRIVHESVPAVGEVRLSDLRRECMLYSGEDLVFSHVLFAPLDEREKFPGVQDFREAATWAAQHHRPYIDLNDNAVAAFIAFDEQAHRRIAERQLRSSVFAIGRCEIDDDAAIADSLDDRTAPSRGFQIDDSDWPEFYRGMFAHGWTVDPRASGVVDAMRRIRLWATTFNHAAYTDLAAPTTIRGFDLVEGPRGNYRLYAVDAPCDLDAYGMSRKRWR
jgi:hypothetical protein